MQIAEMNMKKKRFHSAWACEAWQIRQEGLMGEITFEQRLNEQEVTSILGRKPLWTEETASRLAQD